MTSLPQYAVVHEYLDLGSEYTENKLTILRKIKTLFDLYPEFQENFNENINIDDLNYFYDKTVMKIYKRN